MSKILLGLGWLIIGTPVILLTGMFGEHTATVAVFNGLGSLMFIGQGVMSMVQKNKE